METGKKQEVEVLGVVAPRIEDIKTTPIPPTQGDRGSEADVLNEFEKTIEPLPECEYCGEPSEFLESFDNSDRSVGYYSVLEMCPSCIMKIRLARRNY